MDLREVETTGLYKAPEHEEENLKTVSPKVLRKARRALKRMMKKAKVRDKKVKIFMKTQKGEWGKVKRSKKLKLPKIQ